MNYQLDDQKLKRWFSETKRDLPWRQDPTPYMVWISEVMLQQTQVAVVVPYFLRWMEKYPTVHELAAAPLDEVIKEWEGLGYYSRARSLHEGAKTIVRDFNGIIPQTEEELSRVKGLGPYTIGAILSFAFHKRVPAVDGNVLRVLARFFCIEDDISKPKTVASMRSLAAAILPIEESWIVNEALIELGATVCGRKAKCHACPLKENCLGLANNAVERLPVKTKQMKAEVLYRSVAVVIAENHVLIRRGMPGEIMNDLHEFPFVETGQEGVTPQHIAQKFSKEWSVKLSVDCELAGVRQSFTRYRVFLTPIQLRCQQRVPVDGYYWHPLSDLKQLAFSSGHRRILAQLSSK